MFRHIDAVAVIGHRYGSVFGGNRGFNIGNRFSVFRSGLEHTDNVVATIDNAFVEQFVESGNVFDGSKGDFLGFLVKHPHRRIDRFHRTNIGIGVVENMLFVGLTLVLLSEVGGRHFV